MAERVLVTGGAGFIGSHLVDGFLAAGWEVVVLDNFATGRPDFLADARKRPGFRLVEGDVLDAKVLSQALSGASLVVHAAADPEVRLAPEGAEEHIRQNVLGTHRVLEAMRAGPAKRLVFTSTSTVYGEAATIPTPESYGPCVPISLYGASKLASESIVAAYCHSFGLQAVVVRFANVVGPRSNHGVTFDFVRKLRADPKRLEILGDGRQTKSYCHVEDCVAGILHAEKATRGRRYEVFNVGSEDAIDVRTVARVVAEAMNLRDVELATTGGVEGGRGWKGDVRVMRLAIDKLKALGWRPKHASANAVRRTAEALVA